MAMFGNRFTPGLVGRPSLRRQLDQLSPDREQAFAEQTADLDPRRFKRLYRNRAEGFLRDQRSDAFVTSRLAREAEDEQRRTLYRIQNFGRSPNEILGI